MINQVFYVNVYIALLTLTLKINASFSDHAYVRKWLLLTDLEDKSNTPKGYLKISICVLGAGDQPPVSIKCMNEMAEAF